MKLLQKTTAVLLAVLLLCGSMSLFSGAKEATVVDSGNWTCDLQERKGSGTWSLDSDGKLTISGTGDMDAYYVDESSSGKNAPPWYSLSSSIQSVEIGEGITYVADYGFYACNSLKSAVLPKGLLTIGASAFQGCTALETINMPDSLQWIGSQAFYQCSSLKQINIPYGVTQIDTATFFECKSLKEITIPDSVKVILESAFMDCASLETVAISSTCSEISLSSFAKCVALKTISFGKNIKVIPRRAFEQCSSLSDVYYDGSEADWAKITISEGNDALKNATIHYADAGKDNNTTEPTTQPTTEPVTEPVTQPTYNEPTWEWEGASVAHATFVKSDNSERATITATEKDGTITSAADENGNIVYTATVAFGGKIYTNTYIEKNPSPFEYVDPVWKWTDKDNASATFVSTDGEDTQTVTASSKDGTIVSALDEEGNTVYTATVTFGGKVYTNTFTSYVPDFNEPTWKWSGVKTATATFATTDGKSSSSVTASAKDGTITFAADKNGNPVYTAVVTFKGKTYKDAVTFGKPTWKWSGVKTATATFTSSGKKATVSLTASTADGTIKSEKQKNGDVIYTASVVFAGKTYTNTKTKNAPEYKVVWNWDGVKSAAATFTNTNNGKTKTVTATKSNGGIVSAVSGTCGTNGKTVYTATVTFGGKTYTNSTSTPLPHKWKSALTPATAKADGSKVFTCTVCGQVVNNRIPRIAQISLSETKIVKDGKKHTPKVTVKDSNGKTLKKNKAYTVSYEKGRKHLGVYTVTVTFKGNYSGTKALKFKILPRAPKGVSAAPQDGRAVISWQAVTGADHYYIYLMREGGKSFKQCLKVRGTSAIICSLTNGITYLFKVRAVKTTDKNSLVGPACRAVRVTPVAAPQPTTTAPATTQPTTQAAAPAATQPTTAAQPTTAKTGA